MAEGGEIIIQKPIPTCDNHPSDEVEVYCKHCNKAVCFDCSRIHHHNHDCEGIVKLSRRLRQQIPETCQQIRDGTLYRMKSELESIRLIQWENKEKQKEEENCLENLQTQCMEAVKGIFQSEIKKTSENLKKHNDKLDARVQELIRKIENLNIHVQSHQDSQLTYGKFELLEMDMVLRKMTNDYRSMDTDGAVYSSSVKTPHASTIIESLQKSIKDSLSHVSTERREEIEELDFRTCMIKVSNIPEGTSEEALSYFFENRRKSGGGPIEEIEFHESSLTAFIIFEDSNTVQRILGKSPILFNKKQIHVEAWFPDIGDEAGTDGAERNDDNEYVIEVRGADDFFNHDTLEMYFENKRRSGGGAVIDSFTDKSNPGVIFIKFEDENVMENVLRRKHRVGGKTLEVKKYTPSSKSARTSNQ